MVQPYIKGLRLYVKDSADFILEINNLERIPKNSILAIVDVHSLYTNILNNEDIKGVETTFNQKNINSKQFIINCQNYLQIKVCVIGTKCAVSYANIFKGIFEEKFIYPLINNITRQYLQLTNYISIIWMGTLDQLLEFKQQINEVHPSIKFDFKFLNKEINFLDTVVYKTLIAKLETKLYSNNTNQQAYLHCKSEHSESLNCTNLRPATLMYS